MLQIITILQFTLTQICCYPKFESSVECSAGTYRDNLVIICTECAENSITEQTGAAFCTSCSAGTVSNPDRTQCGNVHSYE